MSEEENRLKRLESRSYRANERLDAIEGKALRLVEEAGVSLAKEEICCGLRYDIDLGDDGPPINHHHFCAKAQQERRRLCEEAAREISSSVAELFDKSQREKVYADIIEKHVFQQT